MPWRFRIRFQPWIVSLTVLLVLLLTGSFLFTVFGKFQSMAEDTALAHLRLVEGETTARLDAFLQEERQLVSVLAQSHPDLFEREGVLDTETLLPTVLAALRVERDLHSVLFGLKSGNFLHVISLANSPAMVSAAAAPEGAVFSVRSVTREPGGQRLERWVFLTANGQKIGERVGETTYDPTERPWFKGAMATGQLYMAEPYRYLSTNDLGITMAAPLPSGGGVVGADVTLSSLSRFLHDLGLSANGAVAVLDGQGRILGLDTRGDRWALSGGDWLLKRLSETGNPNLINLAHLSDVDAESGESLVTIGSETFVVAHARLEPVPGTRYRVITAAPLSDFTAPVLSARRDVLLASVVILLVLVPLALLGTRRVAQGLKSLARDSERMTKLNFSQRPRQVESFLYEVDTLGQAQVVMHDSLRDRTREMEQARAQLAQIVEVGIRMGRETDQDALLRDLLFGARDIAHCEWVTLFIRTEHDTLRVTVRTREGELPNFEIPLYDPETGETVRRHLASHAVLTGKSVVIDDVNTETRFDLSGTQAFAKASQLRLVSMATVPLVLREGEAIGALQLVNCLDPQSGVIVPFDPATVNFMEALAAQAAVTLENQNLLQAQKDLMDSMIKIIAGAIDAKSAYTGGHCERVPELAMMLAEAATQEKEGPLADFGFHTEDEWSEFRIGAWLHDCGKVTTPEYVVDKATKLETIYNRIHEVRTRFEVLLRDAEIATHKAIAAGQEAEGAWAAYEERKRQLQEDFAFVAETNVGGEFMAPERLERIRAIAQQTWWRHFDDRLGLSHEEERRAQVVPPSTLPVQERLLADKPHHIVPRGEDKALDPKYGFHVKVPRHLYNHGEIHNLSTSRGTLNEEERFKINEHIIQTIVMLEQLPFPKYLKRVPEYAGTHHETLLGTGYPRKLTAEQLSVPARIMAIADIFEALAASDRPYKKAKKLSECIRLLATFKHEQHIDPVLFDLFLTSGVYQRYAERYLLPEQIDAVDITAYLG